MKILFLAGREHRYMRNAVMLRALRQFASVDVVAVPDTGGILTRSVIAIAHALPKLSSNYDVIYIGFYGYIILQVLSRLTRKPILFDAFVSNYDTLCFDRQRIAPDSLAGRLAFALDQWSVRRATHILLDTALHIEYFVETFGISADKFTPIPVGSREDVFFPRPLPAPVKSITVLYYCTFLPLHGVEIVIEAARRLQDESIHIRLIGDGPTRSMCEKQADALSNLSFEPPVPPEQLGAIIEQADITLGGHFGNTEKAQRVVPGKIYQLLASGRPIIATDTAANRASLQHGKTAWLIPNSDPHALAVAIRQLANDPALRQQLGQAAAALYIEQFSEASITARLQTVVTQLI